MSPNTATFGIRAKLPKLVLLAGSPYSYGYWNWAAVGPGLGLTLFALGLRADPLRRWKYFGGRWGWLPGAQFMGIGLWSAVFGFFGGGFGFRSRLVPLGFGEPFPVVV